jgi:hypothetical protein
MRIALVQKRCHHYRAEDLADGVSAGQQGHGAGETEQPARRKGHRADADEGGAEQDCPDDCRNCPGRKGGQRDAERLQQQCTGEQRRM